jgi:hypothetical protein
MLSSHHWPGMMFAFLLLLLTPSGVEICSSCFLNEGVKEPDYDWDSAPFLHQVGARMHEKLIMTKAKQFSVVMAKYYYGKQNIAPSPGDASNDITHTLPHNKMYVISDKICMMTTRLACNRAIESSYWRMDNNSDVGLLTGYVLY